MKRLRLPRCLPPTARRLYSGDGYHDRPPVPDRLRGVYEAYGADARVVNDTEYDPARNRSMLHNDILGSASNIQNYDKFDKIRPVLDRSKKEPWDHPSWREAYQLIRSCHPCCELLALPSDTYPQGEARWVDLSECTVARLPYFAQLDNGIVVLPVFSMEEYMVSFFMRVDRWESISTPQGKAGTMWEAYCKLPFPVLAYGPLQKFNAFATVAVPDVQVALVLDPFKPWTKFISYPEMLFMAKSKPHEPFGFDRNLVQCINTVKWNFKVISHEEAATIIKADKRGIPHIALLEMHHMLFVFPRVEWVAISTHEKSIWNRVVSRENKFTLIEVALQEGASTEQDPETEQIEQAVKSWSYLSEFPTTVEVEFKQTLLKPAEGATVVYTHDDGKLFRRSTNPREVGSVRKKLGFDEALPMAPRMWKDDKPAGK